MQKPKYTGGKGELVLRTPLVSNLIAIGIISGILLVSVYLRRELIKTLEGQVWIASLIGTGLLIWVIYLIYDSVHPYPKIIINDFGIWTRRYGLIEWIDLEKFAFMKIRMSMKFRMI